MDYTSFREITTTIIAVLQDAIDSTNTIKVLPELLRNDEVGVGFYLYHVQESPHYKNYPSVGKDNPPVNYTPMALNLFYQLSANRRDQERADAYDEQDLMSIAMKTLHDNAIITSTNPGSKDIHIKITLQTLSPSESIQYWAAADSPVRLSAYYEVSVVFLQPEKPKSYAGRVIAYGNYVFINNLPQISSSETTIDVKVPGETRMRQIVASPAQASPAAALPGAALNKITFNGSGFGDGLLELLLIHPDWTEPAVADPVNWELVRTADHAITVTVKETALLQKSLTPVDILPGLYAAQVSLKITRATSAGIKTFTQLSNQFPFLVTPRVSGINPLAGGAGTTFVVDIYLVQHVLPVIAPEDIQVYLGEDQLHYNPGVLNAGEYRFPTPAKVELRAPAILAKGLIPVRVLVRGIESGPAWITGT